MLLKNVLVLFENKNRTMRKAVYLMSVRFTKRAMKTEVRSPGS